MRRLIRIAGVAALSASFFARAAHSAEVHWQAPSECPRADEVISRIELALGTPLSQASSLVFDASTVHTEDRFVTTLTVRQAAADVQPRLRVLGAADCSKLVDAVATAVVLALGVPAINEDEEAPTDDQAQTEPSGGSDSATGAEETRGTNVTPVAQLPDHQSNSPSEQGNDVSVGVSLWLVGDVGSLPRPGLGTALGLGVSWERLALRAQAVLLFEQHAEIEVTAVPPPGADLVLITGSLGLCFAGIRETAFTLWACLGGEIGRLSGRGVNLGAPRSGGVLWLAPRVDLVGAWSLPNAPLKLGVVVGLATPVNRNEFILEGVGSIYRPASVVGHLQLGAELTLN